ncbi:MAG: MBL fold metallo-hydrolase [Spirochaetales bacterium]|nr:MBL fold metallo-hydrolase [Spirochaetales bacterium]
MSKVEKTSKEPHIAVTVKVHQGADRIGGTCIEISSSMTTILLDIGQPLPEIGEETSEKDYSLPDLPSSIDAVFISHYHKDHWGLIHLTDDTVPFYLPGKAREILLLQQKLIGRDLCDRLEQALVYKPDQTIQIGDISVKTHLMDHSAMDACAFEITVEDQRIVYTGDFRRHGRKGKLWYGFINKIQQPFDTLLCEGTMLSRQAEHVPRESDLEQRAVSTLKENKLALAWTSSVNYDRITTFYRAARRTGRILAVDIFTAHMMSLAASGTGLPDPMIFDDIRVYYPPGISRMIEENGGAKMLYKFRRKKVTYAEVDQNPKKYLILTRPSCYRGWLDRITKWKDSVLFYSQWSGYRELPRNTEFLKILNLKGCRDVTLHTSGHADTRTIQETIERLNPGEIIPVHTEEPGWFMN